jgi:hypothetical protein
MHSEIGVLEGWSPGVVQPRHATCFLHDPIAPFRHYSKEFIHG